jgi:hypothetical protein
MKSRAAGALGAPVGLHRMLSLRWDNAGGAFKLLAYLVVLTELHHLNHLLARKTTDSSRFLQED